MAKLTCSHCGAPMDIYKHGLSRGIVEGLEHLYNNVGMNGEVNLKDLGLSRNQWDNFQKLRYWELVYQVFDKGKRKAGVWGITKRGRDFIEARISVEKHVWTYRGETVSSSLVQITKQKALEKKEYKKRPQYAADSVPLLG